MPTSAFNVTQVFVKAGGLKNNTYFLQSYQRSNQDTCLHQRPAVAEGEWVYKGDFISDSSSSVSGDLSVGKNILVGYMPWEGYNFEDAIVVSERLVNEGIYTSLHIERYDVEIEGTEQITSKIYELVFPQPKGYQKDKKKNSNRPLRSIPAQPAKPKQRQSPGRYGVANLKTLEHLDKVGVVKVGTWVEPHDILVAKVTPLPVRQLSPQERLFYTILDKEPAKYKDTSLRVPETVRGRVVGVRTINRSSGDHTPSSGDLAFSDPLADPAQVYVFIAKQRKLQVGDKMAGRHGNKGIVSIVLPKADMPYLANGTPLDMVLNPLGVPSRMNVGQVFESLLGLAGGYLNQAYKVVPFDEMYGPEASRSLVFSKLYEARVKTGQNWLFQPSFPGKTKLFDGRTGECFHQSVTVGRAYMLKLAHLVDKKIHARATGPYSLITQQPVRGRAHHGGQRLGEMEVWAFEGFGASYNLQECLTIKSDDTRGRYQIITAITKGNESLLCAPESFKLVISELQSLCLNIKVLASQIDIKGLHYEFSVTNTPAL